MHTTYGKKGYTFVESCVVIVIIAIVACMIISSVAREKEQREINELATAGITASVQIQIDPFQESWAVVAKTVLVGSDGTLLVYHLDRSMSPIRLKSSTLQQSFDADSITIKFDHGTLTLKPDGEQFCLSFKPLD